MKKPLYRSLLFILILSLITTGCWDRVELEERNLVLAMAIDRGTNDQLKVSVQIPIPANIVGRGGSGAGQGSTIQQLDVEAGTLSEALTRMERKANKSLFLGYLQTLLFGEEQAKMGIGDFMDVLRRDPTIQRRLYPIVVKGKGGQLLEENKEMEDISAIFIQKMIDVGNDTGTLIPTNLNNLLINLSTPTLQAPMLNYIGIENGRYRWLGLAAFRDDRLMGILNTYETIILLNIRKKMVGQALTVSCPQGDGKIQFTPLNLRRKIKVTEKPSLTVFMEIEGNMTERTCKQNLSEERDLHQTELQVQKEYERLANDLLKKSQKEWNTDIFLLGNYVNAYHPDIYRKANWKQEFHRIPINISYQVHIRRMGIGTK